MVLQLLFRTLMPADITGGVAGTAQLAQMLTTASFWHVVAGVATAVSLQFVAAPFGKLMQGARDGDKMSLLHTLMVDTVVDARWGWLLQELPTLIAVAVQLLVASRAGGAAVGVQQWAPLTLFVLHYVQRCFVYPIFTMSTTNKEPLGVSAMANFYCCFNGRLQAAFFFYSAYGQQQGPVSHFWMWVGIAIFLIGFVGNVTHDRMLASLRKRRGGGGYMIPRGGLFEYVSAANLVAEMVEWIGYAVVCAASAGWVGFYVGGSFAAYVVANLAPRAIAAHRWYLRRFEPEYQRLGRAALFPGLL